MDVLDLKECKEDTPMFRRQLMDHEDAVLALENSVKSLLKLSKASVELAQEYSTRQLLMAEEMATIAQSQRGHDFIVTQSIDAFARSIQELERNRLMMNTQITQMFIEPMENFLKNEVLPVKESRKQFQQISDEADLVLHRYMSKKPRDQAIPEASKDVADARKKLHIEYVDYCIKLNELQAKEKFEFTEHVVTYMYTLSSFHHRGHDVLGSVEPAMSTITENIQGTRSRFTEDKPLVKALREETLNVGNEIYYPLRPFGAASDDMPTQLTTRSGYLYKKGHQRIMPSWNRWYFEIEGELLMYGARGKKTKAEDEAAQIINLRVCTVKMIENGDRPHLFEVISPMRVHVLQAENTEDMKEWVHCLQNAITAAHNSDQAPEVRGFGVQKERHEPIFSPHGVPLNGNTDEDKQLLLQVRKIPGNEVCADCRSLSPMWASVNHGTVHCIECSGIHRSMGVHVSKVRSLNLDKWETEAVGLMLKLGNEKTNKIYESKIQKGNEKRWITVNSERAEKERFILAKYLKKDFITTGEDTKEFLTRSVHETFWHAMDVSDYCEAMRCLALGANVDHVNADHDATTPLHRAIARGDNIAAEFLFQWFCDINATDGQGWCALHHAVANNNAKALTSLIKKHAKYDICNRSGQTPLDLAKVLDKSEALIVLQIYQFEHQQTEQTRPSSAQSGSMTIPGSISSPASFSDVSSFTATDVFPTLKKGAKAIGPNGSLPPLLHTATTLTAGQPLSTSASAIALAGATVLAKDTIKPGLSSRNSTGTFSTVSKSALSATTPARFSVADARSLAAMGSGSNPWADEMEAAKTNAVKKAKDFVDDHMPVAGHVIKEEREDEE